jgi:hypothetical protein
MPLNKGLSEDLGGEGRFFRVQAKKQKFGSFLLFY